MNQKNPPTNPAKIQANKVVSKVVSPLADHELAFNTRSISKNKATHSPIPAPRHASPITNTIFISSVQPSQRESPSSRPQPRTFGDSRSIRDGQRPTL